MTSRIAQLAPRAAVEVMRRTRDQTRLRRIGIAPLSGRGNVRYLGTSYGGYAVPTSLRPGEIALCFGAGEDISFEIALAREFGMSVHAFDPTPRAIEYCKRVIADEEARGLAGTLAIHAFGVWSECKIERFFAPRDPSHVSHSILNMQETTDYFEAECLTPKAILQRLRIEMPTLVKLNIEGAEYEVMHSLFEMPLLPRVICITFDEMHSKMDANANSRLKCLVGEFDARSYRPIHAMSSNVTFVRDGD